MLTKDEEHRLASCIDVLRSDVKNDPSGQNQRDYSGLDLKTQLWLAENLQRVNQELTAALEDRVI